MLLGFPKPALSLGDLYFAESLRQVDGHADDHRSPRPTAPGVSPWLGLLRPGLLSRFRIPRVDIPPDRLQEELTDFVNQCRDGAASLGTREVPRDPAPGPLPPE